MSANLNIRRVQETDLPAIIALDARITSVSKADYWNSIFQRFSENHANEQVFLVAETQDEKPPRLLGYIAGEVRAWEFGSDPCGWVFAISVEPDTRLQGVGEELIAAISTKFRNAGITTMRTMVARNNQLHMAFFRSEGMVAGPYLQLEMDLKEANE